MVTPSEPTTLSQHTLESGDTASPSITTGTVHSTDHRPGALDDSPTVAAKREDWEAHNADNASTVTPLEQRPLTPSSGQQGRDSAGCIGFSFSI